MTPRKLLGEARVHTFEYVPYLASYIYSLRERETPGIGTAAVDRDGNLYWDPDFIVDIGRDQTAYLVAHEVLHLIFDHHKRSDEILGPDPSDFERYVCNVAGDLAIEQTLHMMRHLRPEGAVHLGCEVPAWGIRLDFPANRSMQEYYRLIMEKLRKKEADESAEQQGGVDGQSDADGQGAGERGGCNHGTSTSRDQGSAGDDGPKGDQADANDEEPEDGDDAWNDAQDELDEEWESLGSPSGQRITASGWEDENDLNWGWTPPPPGYDDDEPDPEADWEEDDYDSTGESAFPPGQVGLRSGPAPGSPGTGGSCADGCPRPYEIESDGTWEADGEERAAQAEAAINQSERERPGSVPGALRQAIRLKLRRTPDPFAVLRSAVCSSVASPVGVRDFSRRRRSRKQPPDEDQPLLHGRCTVQPKAVVIVDTSGSMLTKEIQAKALSVIAQGLRKLGRIRVYCADTKVQANQMVVSIKHFQWCGGGGTDMSTAIEQVDRDGRPDSIVLVTDAQTHWHGKKPRARVIVAYTGAIGSAWHKQIPAWCRVVPLARKGDC